MANDIEASSRVILRGPGNWDAWISIIRKQAKNQNVWEYINPDLDNKPTLTRPTEPAASEVRADATEIGNLEGDDFTKFQILENRYNSKLKTYRHTTKALAII